MTETMWVIVGLVGLSCLVGFAVKAARAIKPIKSLAWRKYINAGLEAFGRGNYPEAEKQFKAALATALYLGATDRRTAESFKNLAKLYPDGIYALMALAVEGAIKKEEVLGPNHPDVAESLERLAELYGGLKIFHGYHGVRWNYRAEQFYRRALAIKEKALGPDHLEVAQSLESLAESDGFVPESMSFKVDSNPLRRALDIRENILGPDHLEVVRSLEKLMIGSGEFFDNPYRHPEIVTYLKRVLEVREKALGPEHPLVASTHENLGDYYFGVCYEDRDFFEQALAHFEKALEVREKALGPEHPDVARSLRVLGRYYDLIDRYVDVRVLRLREVKILEKALGPESPEHYLRKELMELRVENKPQDFSEYVDVIFERISVTEEEITLVKLVTKPSVKSVHGAGLEAGTVTSEKITPKEVFENPKIVPQKRYSTITEYLFEDYEYPKVGLEV